MQDIIHMYQEFFKSSEVVLGDLPLLARKTNPSLQQVTILKRKSHRHPLV